MGKRSLFTLISIPLLLMAKPSGPEVVQGNATFAHPTKNTMQIVTGDQTIINWDSFSIDAQEITKFVQPGSNSAVLNRVTSLQGSHILGALQANGKVFLINPNGILIGPDAVINTHSFIASTLDVLDSEFMQGKALRFRGNSEYGVVNLGSINARDGDIALIGRYVENKGELHAPKGMAALAVGKEVLLKPSGEERIFICALSQNSTKKGTGITSQGEIEALKVRLLADGNPYKLAINHEGKIDATQVEERHGEIYLIAENGFVEVNGEISAVKGDIRVLGETVVLHEQALVDASCSYGSGRVLIGGSFQGKDPNILNSEQTFIHPGATVKVNSYLDGDGGLAVIWSDGATHFHGLVEAQGGERGGNGGTVEVSGKRLLDIEGGLAKRPAPMGTPGKLLLDPSNVLITEAHTTDVFFIDSATFIPTGVVSTLGVQDLIRQLQTGPVEVTTYSAFRGDGDITVATNMDGDVGYATEHDLTLTSDRDLIIQASVQNGGTGNIICNVGRDLQMDGSSGIARLGTQLGNVSIKTGRDVLLVGGAAGQAQIGFDNPSMNSNIEMTIGGDLMVQSIDHFALIGHTNTKGGARSSLEGNITIHSVGKNLFMSALGTDNQFAQIGIASDQNNSDSSGPVTISGNVTVQNVNGTVKLLGGTKGKGAYTLIGHGGRGRSFTDTYTGNISVHSKGDIFIIGGQSAASENFAGIGFGQEFATPSTHHVTSKFVSVGSGGNLFIKAGHGSNPGFIGAFTGYNNGNALCHISEVHVHAGNDLTLLGNSKAGPQSDAAIGIIGTNGPAICNIRISAQNDLLLTGANPEKGISNAFIRNSIGLDGGRVDITAHKGNIFLTSGFVSHHNQSQAFIHSSGDLNLYTLKGDLDIASHDPVFIRAAGIAHIFAGRNISMAGDGRKDSASITAGQLLTMEAGHDIYMIHRSLIQNHDGALDIIAGNNLEMGPQSVISNLSDHPINIVVDNSSPKSPGIGAFYMDAGAKISGLGMIRIHTAKQELNKIYGEIGGSPFNAGALFISDSPEKWLSFYSDSFYHAGSPYTVYYKNGVLSANNIERSQVLVSEMLTDLHAYDEYLGWFLNFQTAYALSEYEKVHENGTSSFQVIPEQLYYLRMKNNFDHNPRINHFITFPKSLETGPL